MRETARRHVRRPVSCTSRLTRTMCSWSSHRVSGTDSKEWQTPSRSWRTARPSRATRTSSTVSRRAIPRSHIPGRLVSTVLVTGAGGFVGSAVVRRLIAARNATLGRLARRARGRHRASRRNAGPTRGLDGRSSVERRAGRCLRRAEFPGVVAASPSPGGGQHGTRRSSVLRLGDRPRSTRVGVR